MLENDRVLIAILNSPKDFAFAQDEHWYRIPVESAERWAGERWPPDWVAFYQPKIFGPQAFAVNYFGQVLDIKKAYRWELFPDEPASHKSAQQYYKLLLGPLAPLARPIVSKRWPRITFIPTTWPKFIGAREINDLFDESPLEDRLWAEFQRLGISVERQEFVKANGRNYALDFSIYCIEGKLDVETDGDLWHSDRERIALDNVRANDLETQGWRLLRFNTRQIQEQMAEYCLPTIEAMVASLGGIKDKG